MTDIQKTIVAKLEELVGKRFSSKTLNQELSKIFNEEIKGEDCTNFDNKPCDYNFMFNSKKEDTFGYFDIYYLKMINPGFDDADMYVTEISFEFE